MNATWLKVNAGEPTS